MTGRTGPAPSSRDASHGVARRTIGRGSAVGVAWLLAVASIPSSALAAPTPQDEASAPQAPEAETPEAEAPEAETPEAETPEAETPEAETPEAETPEAQAPEAQAPEAETPEAADTEPAPDEAPGEPPPRDEAEPEPAEEPADDSTVADEEVEPEETEGSARLVQDDAPERLPVLQQAGWWSVFGAFVTGTTAGVLAGLAERQEDEAVRLANRVDPRTGDRLLYADVQDDYESALERGDAYEKSAIVLSAVTGALVVTAATLFIVDAVRSKRRNEERQVTLSPTGVRIRF